MDILDFAAQSKNFVNSNEATAPPAECPVKMTCFLPLSCISFEICLDAAGSNAFALLRKPECANIGSLLLLLSSPISSFVCSVFLQLTA